MNNQDKIELNELNKDSNGGTELTTRNLFHHSSGKFCSTIRMVEEISSGKFCSTDFQVMNSMVSKLSLLASASSILTELRSIIYMISPAIRKLHTFKIQLLELAFKSWSSALTGSINSIVIILEFHIAIIQQLSKQASSLFHSLTNQRTRYVSFIRPRLIVDWRFWFLSFALSPRNILTSN